MRRASSRFALHLDADLPSAKTYSAEINRYQKTEIAFLRHQGVHISVLRRFHVLVDGLSVRMPTTEVSKLMRLPNVQRVQLVRRYHELLDRSIKLVHAPQAWTELGGSSRAGRGVMIANVDSGIDISHPCFRDQGYVPPPGGRRADTAANYALTNNKVVVARAFGVAGKHYSAADRSPSEGGHGTFTAAIEACDYNTSTPLGTHVSGVAPAAYLMNYNIFPDGSSETSPDDPVIPALEAAVLDGADIINLSFGDVLQGDPRLDADTQAVESAVKNGVVVVAAAGNAGPTSQSISSPATAPDAISVGSTTNSHVISSTVDLTDTALPARLMHLQASEATHGFTTPVGPEPIAYIGMARRQGDDPSNPKADDFGSTSLAGHIALIERGNIPFQTKIKNAAAAGADGAIIFDNVDEPSVPMIDEGSAILPVMSVSLRDGKYLLNWWNSHPSVSATLDPKLS
ncbi:MAG TPA: S8 family serine peptidase, partial [Chloroflexota bacterium]